MVSIHLKPLTEHIGLYLLSALPGGTIVLSLESGNLLHLDPALTGVARAIAQGASVNDTVGLTCEALKLPRYVARERVRSLHLKLDGELSGEELPTPGIRGTARLRVHHLGENPCESAEIEVGTAASARGKLLFVGPGAEATAMAFRREGERYSDNGPHFDTLGLHALGRQSTSWGPIDQVWFQKVSPKAVGFTLLGIAHDVGFMRLLSSVKSEHNPREWLKLFEATTLLFAGAQAYEVTCPSVAKELEFAVRGFLDTSAGVGVA